MNGNGNVGINIILQKRIRKDSILYVNHKKYSYTWDDVKFISINYNRRKSG